MLYKMTNNNSLSTGLIILAPTVYYKYLVLSATTIRQNIPHKILGGLPCQKCLL